MWTRCSLNRRYIRSGTVQICTSYDNNFHFVRFPVLQISDIMISENAQRTAHWQCYGVWLFLELILLYLRCNIVSLSAVASFQREFLTSEMKEGKANVAQVVSRETFELFLRHFFDCAEGTSRRDIIFYKTLSYDARERTGKILPYL